MRHLSGCTIFREEASGCDCLKGYATQNVAEPTASEVDALAEWLIAAARKIVLLDGDGRIGQECE